MAGARVDPGWKMSVEDQAMATTVMVAVTVQTVPGGHRVEVVPEVQAVPGGQPHQAAEAAMVQAEPVAVGQAEPGLGPRRAEALAAGDRIRAETRLQMQVGPQKLAS